MHTRGRDRQVLGSAGGADNFYFPLAASQVDQDDVDKKLINLKHNS